MDNNKIIELHSKGMSDSEIGKFLNIERRTVCYIRNKLNLSSNIKLIDLSKEYLIEQLKNKSITKLAKEINISSATIGKFLRKYNIKCQLNYDFELVEKLYNLGKNDVEIAKEVKVSTQTIANWRNRFNKKTNFEYTDMFTKQDLEPYINKGLTDLEISKLLNCSISTIFDLRKKYKIDRKSYSVANYYEPTQRQLEILIGTILGDSSLIKCEKSINAKFKCSHGLKQKEYCKWKYNEFLGLNMKFNYRIRKTPDKRNGNIYESYNCESTANSYFTPLYHLFYKDKIKTIPFELFENFTALSLAVLFMDDGAKAGNSVSIALMCFTKEDLEIFTNMIYGKFGILFTICKDRIIYLPQKYYEKFKSIVLEHIHPTLLYKLSI